MTVHLASMHLQYPCRNILFLPLISVFCHSSYFSITLFIKKEVLIVNFLPTLQDVYALCFFPLKQKRHEDGFVVV